MNFAVTAPPNVPVRPTDPSPHRFATALMLVYLFLLVSRLVEMLPSLIGVNLHLTLILSLVLMLAALSTGGLFHTLWTPVGMMFTALTAWLLLTTFGSEWRGGSVTILSVYWVTSYACAMLLPSLLSTLDQCKKALYTLAFCLVPILLATVVFQHQMEGREATAFGTLGNPNELAFTELLTIPFGCFLIRTESLRSWKTLVCLFAILFASVSVLRTGSRSALVTLVVCFAILFLAGKLQAKVKAAAGAAVIAVIALTFAPSDVLRRYLTVLSGTSTELGMTDDERSAVESTRARQMLFQESVRVMLNHPLLGVGPGVFSASLAREQKERGQEQTWHEAHNSYTQLGSEAGIPALMMYLGVVFYCTKRTVSIYRRTRRDPNQIVVCRMAASLAMAMVIFIIAASFGTYSYTFHLAVLAGLVQAFDVCVRKEMSARPSVVPVRLPTRPVAPTPKPQVSTYVRNRRLRHDRV